MSPHRLRTVLRSFVDMPATVPLSQANPNTRHLHTIPLPGGIPDTHREHSEATTTILVPKDAGAFLNPVQGFNRDLSVAVIRAWNELRKEELEGRWRAKGNTRKRKEQKKTKQERDSEPSSSSTSYPAKDHSW